MRKLMQYKHMDYRECAVVRGANRDELWCAVVRGVIVWCNVVCCAWCAVVHGLMGCPDSYRERALWCLWYVKVALWCSVVAVIFQLFFLVHWCSFGGAGRDVLTFYGFAGTIHTVKQLCECDLRKNLPESDFC